MSVNPKWTRTKRKQLIALVFNGKKTKPNHILEDNLRQTIASALAQFKPHYITWYCMHLRPVNHWDVPKVVILHSIFLHSNHSVALYKPNRVRKST